MVERDDDGELWHGVVVGLLLEGLALVLFLLCFTIWAGVITGAL